MKLRSLALATPFVLAVGFGMSQAATTGSAVTLTPVLVDTATISSAADGTVNVPGVLSAIVLPSAANQVRLGSVRLNGVEILDAASLDCTGAHPALLLAPTAGVVLPSVPSAGTAVTVPGVGPLILNSQQPGNGVSYVSGISGTINGHTVNLLNGTCAGTSTGSSARLAPVGGTGAGTIGVEVAVTGAPTGTSSAPDSSTPAATPDGSSPALDTPATLPPRGATGPGEAPAPSPVPGSGGVTG